MAVLLSETFTGTNGAVWNASNWVLGVNPTQAGGATIQSNTGRLAGGTLGSYNGNDRISRRANIASVSNVDMRFSVKFDATESYPRVYVRSSNSVDTGTGYNIVINKGTWGVSRSVSYSTTDISPAIPYTYTQDTFYRVRFYVVGSTIKAKLWLASSSEPLAWSWEGTDSTITAAGAVGFTTNSGAAASSGLSYFDDIVISDGVVNSAPTVDVGADTSIKKGATFTRTATASDSDGTISVYAWTIQSRPAGSVATSSGNATSTITFIPDKIGTYVIRCTVTDDFNASTYDELTLTLYGQGRRKNLRVSGAWQTKVVRVRQGGAWV
jgi:hypothetical protein